MSEQARRVAERIMRECMYQVLEHEPHEFDLDAAEAILDAYAAEIREAAALEIRLLQHERDYEEPR